MSRPFLPLSRPDLGGAEKRYVNQALDEGWISGSGRFLARFEREFAAYCGTRHAVACCNGTAALHMALLAAGVGPGDEVIVPALTYVASANAVTYTGARPVFVDSEPEHWNLDAEKVPAAITARTKAILAVHLYGHPADMRALQAVADGHRIAVIEDAAEAHGAEVGGRRAGGLGVAAAFSFYGNKILTTGEGGMVTTSDDALAARLRLLRGQGVTPARRYWFETVGYNYRMTNLAAAIGCAQLERVEQLIEERLRVARRYDSLLAPRAAALRCQLASEAAWARHVRWLYCLRVPAAQRDALAAHLFERGIDTRPFFPPMHLLPMYRGQGPFPVAEELAATGLSLPTWPGLEDAAIARVCAETLGFLEARA